MRYRYVGVSALLLFLLAELAPGQPAPQDAGVLPTGRDLDLRYVGASTRLGIGYNTRDKLRGDAYQVFGETERSAWIGELWLSERSAAGAQAVVSLAARRRWQGGVRAQALRRRRSEPLA